METSYNLSTIPEGKWSGKGPIPAIGDRVHINFNSFGAGTVRSYFVEGGWVGVEVECDQRPEWHIKQNGNTHTRPLVFGAELKQEG